MVIQDSLDSNIHLNFPNLSSFLQEESQLSKVSKDSSKITVEQVHGLMSQVNIDYSFAVRPTFFRMASLSRPAGHQSLQIDL